jgi:hypothetical protein
MKGDLHVRFCGNAGVKFRCVTRLGGHLTFSFVHGCYRMSSKIVKMNKGKIAYYLILFLTIFLAIFSKGKIGPQVIDPDIYRIKDSIFLADSMKYLSLSKHLSQNSKEYEKKFNQEVEAVCKKDDIDIPPSIYSWTDYNLTGIGLIHSLNKDRSIKPWLFLIPSLFYFWMLIQIFVVFLNKKLGLIRYSHIFMIILSFAMLILIILKLPMSIYFYLLFSLIVVKEIRFLKKLNAP